MDKVYMIFQDLDTTLDFVVHISLPFEPAWNHPKSVMSILLLRKYNWRY
jgi:hypothetical protein